MPVIEQKRQFVVRIEYAATVEADNEADAIRLTSHQVADYGPWTTNHRHITVKVMNEIGTPKPEIPKELEEVQEKAQEPEPPPEAASEAEPIL